MRIPFDSFVLEAVVRDLQAFVGGKIQEIRQPNDTDIALSIYAGGREAMLLLSCHTQFFRAHFITKRPSTLPNPPQFLSALRSRITGGRVVQIEQVEGDRILDMVIEAGDDSFRLVAELMSRHASLMLLDSSNKVVAAAKWIGRSHSVRPIQPNQPYVLPPAVGESTFRGKFSERLMAAGGNPDRLAPVLSPGNGAYPVSVASLGLAEHSRQSISIALEQHYDQAIPAAEAESVRGSLLAQLSRVIAARDGALHELRQAEEAGGRAAQWQRWGELVLAYGPSAGPGATIHAWDYDGTEVAIPVDPELDFKANANRLFEKAKKAKGRMGLVTDQIARLSQDREAVVSLRSKVEEATRLDALHDLQDEARRRRWLTEQRAPTRVKEDRPYEGHRVRELTAPGGYTVLYGENAEANDYLTLRVAKPNDLWLHVRGATSAHVVIQSRNQPDRVQRETILYAAKVAVQNSSQKHASYVPVDYTLKKYVRKPKGAAKGSAFYTHEKTVHVEA